MKLKKIPMRRCIGCMESKPKRELIRIVCSEDTVRPDPTGKANGRGAYLCKTAECFVKSKKRRAFSRALGMELTEAQLVRLLGDLEEVFDIEH
jgi:predicted RNA-binding protein YlxR (DUF448 family)